MSRVLKTVVDFQEVSSSPNTNIPWRTPVFYNNGKCLFSATEELLISYLTFAETWLLHVSKCTQTPWLFMTLEAEGRRSRWHVRLSSYWERDWDLKFLLENLLRGLRMQSGLRSQILSLALNLGFNLPYRFGSKNQRCGGHHWYSMDGNGSHFHHNYNQYAVFS